jgi:PilZ domain
MVAMLENPSRMKLVPTGSERRMFARREDHRRILARRMDHTLDARRQPDLFLAMRDLSIGGVGAISDVALKIGECVAVFVTGNELGSSWHMQGHVVRCQASATGYRLGVAFDTMPAAA